MAKITLALEPRTTTGKKVKKLRQQGIIPANVFGKNVKSLAVQVKNTLLHPVLEQAGETQIVYVRIGKEKDERPILITNVQFDPLTDTILHVDFRQVDLKEKVTANIPVELVGESPAVRDLAASLITSLSEVEVEALPADLPENIQVDVSGLKNVGDVIKVADLPLDHTKLEVKDEPETVVVSVAGQQKEEVAPAPAPEAEAAQAEIPPSGTAPTEGTPAETARTEEPKSK